MKRQIITVPVSVGDPRIKVRLKQKPIPMSSAPLLERVLLVSAWVLFLLYTAVILFDGWIVPAQWCHQGRQRQREGRGGTSTKSDRMCNSVRSIYRLGLTPLECDSGRRVTASMLFGSAIGLERKAVDRPAGIRTMSLVCLGACLFTLCGQFAFRASTQSWDAARVSAAVPSGVGFLGSALIWKETQGPKATEDERHSVHGITTAASVWLSASVGIGAGGGLYLYCTWAVVLVMFVLRLGPQMAFLPLDDDVSYHGQNGEWETGPSRGDGHGDDGVVEEETASLSREQQLQLLREEAAALSLWSLAPDECIPLVPSEHDGNNTTVGRIPSMHSMAASLYSRRSRRSVKAKPDSATVSFRS